MTTLESWDIDAFPLKTEAATPRRTPAQQASDKWLAENSDESFEKPVREVQPGDLDRLTREHQDDPNDRFFGVPTGGGGLAGGVGMHYPSGGYNQPERSYPGQEEHEPGDREDTSWLHGFTPHRWADDDEEHEPVNYHVVTRPRGSIPGLNAFNEHEYTMFEHPDHDMDPEGAWASFEEDHPDHDVERHPNTATHEVVHVHPAEHHDTWRNQLSSEDEDFSRISQHGLEREAPNVPGHRSYRHTDPHGDVHRLWHNQTTFHDGPNIHGPGWRVSHYNPELPHESQTPWSYHGDDSPTDSLQDALDRVERNKIHAHITHSGTGMGVIENAYGRHYVSRRPDGSPHQMLRDFRDANDNPDWNVVHYPAGETGHTFTSHGTDLPGALEQARRNLARG